MKRLILGDMHGRFDTVHKIYDFEQPEDVIMLGDYVDTHDNISDADQHDAVKKLLLLRYNHIKENKGKFVLLLGNHDFQYLYGNPMSERYSCYSYERAEWAAEFFQQLVKTKEIQIAYVDEINKTVFTHAGVSNTWANSHNLTLTDINDILGEGYNTKWEFLRFTYGSSFSSSGDCPESSCIWIRPFSLYRDMYRTVNNEIWTQIVGHTPCRGDIFGIAPGYDGCVTDLLNAKIICCDNLDFQYLVETLDENGKVIERCIKNVKDIK